MAGKGHLNEASGQAEKGGYPDEQARIAAAEYRGRLPIVLSLLVVSCAQIAANRMHAIYGDLLTEGIDTNNPQTVERALAQGENINRHSKDDTGITPLMEAAALNANRALEVLLRRGADVNALSNHGSTALMVTAAGGNLTGAKMLLDHGAEVNTQDNQGCTALYLAVNHRNVEAVKLLLAHGADPHLSTRKGTTPLDLTTQKYKDYVNMSGEVTRITLDPAARKNLTKIAGLLKSTPGR